LEIKRRPNLGGGFTAARDKSARPEVDECDCFNDAAAVSKSAPVAVTSNWSFAPESPSYPQTGVELDSILPSPSNGTFRVYRFHHRVVLTHILPLLLSYNSMTPQANHRPRRIPAS